jgi:hypothetical protein
VGEIKTTRFKLLSLLGKLRVEATIVDVATQGESTGTKFETLSKM